MKKSLLVYFLFILIFVISACSDVKAYDIVTTLYPQYDIAVTLAEDDLSVYNVLPFGMSPHQYELTSQDIEAITLSQVLIYTSDAIDPWVSDLILNDTIIYNTLEVLETTYGFEPLLDTHEEDEVDHEDGHDHEGEDPHYWTDPHALLSMVDMVLDIFKTLKPELSSTFESRATEYKASLNNEFDLLSSSLATYDTPTTLYIAGHNALEYYAHYYDLEIVSLFPDFIPDAELTSSQLLTFIEAIETANISYFFIEPLFESEPLAAEQILTQLEANDFSAMYAEIYQFHTISQTQYDNGVTLLDLLIHNREVIIASLESNHA